MPSARAVVNDALRSSPFGLPSLSLVPSEPLITITQDSEGWFIASARYSPRHDIQTGMGMTEERAVEMLKRRLHTWDTTR